MRSPDAVLELIAYHDACPHVFDEGCAEAADPKERAARHAARTAARFALIKLMFFTR
jgi:hypothetical protein